MTELVVEPAVRLVVVIAEQPLGIQPVGRCEWLTERDRHGPAGCGPMRVVVAVGGEIGVRDAVRQTQPLSQQQGRCQTGSAKP